MRRVSLAVVAFAFASMAIAAVSPLACADEPMTRTQADTIIDELRQIRKLLERVPAAPATGASAAPARSDERVKVGMGTLPALGRSDAPITIVEFTDYQCPFCRSFHMTVFEEMKRNYVDTGKVRYVSRDLPLPMHPNAMSAALAARCAGEQGKEKFWEMRHRLIVNASQLGFDRYNALAEELKLDRPRFQKCLAEEKYKAEIAKDMADAQAANINGTPTFIIGRADREGVEGIPLKGAHPYAIFDDSFKALLNTR